MQDRKSVKTETTWQQLDVNQNFRSIRLSGKVLNGNKFCNDLSRKSQRLRLLMTSIITSTRHKQNPVFSDVSFHFYYFLQLLAKAKLIIIKNTYRSFSRKYFTIAVISSSELQTPQMKNVVLHYLTACASILLHVNISVGCVQHRREPPYIQRASVMDVLEGCLISGTKIASPVDIGLTFCR